MNLWRQARRLLPDSLRHRFRHCNDGPAVSVECELFFRESLNACHHRTGSAVEQRKNRRRPEVVGNHDIAGRNSRRRAQSVDKATHEIRADARAQIVSAPSHEPYAVKSFLLRLSLVGFGKDRHLMPALREFQRETIPEPLHRSSEHSRHRINRPRGNGDFHTNNESWQ